MPQSSSLKCCKTLALDNLVKVNNTVTTNVILQRKYFDVIEMGFIISKI